MILLEISSESLLLVLIFILLIALSPAIVLFIIAWVYRKKKPKVSKILFIICGMYFVIGGGVCGVLVSSE